MDKIDVFVLMDRDDGAGASLAVRALKAKVKASVDQWFLLGTRGDRLETLAHTVGAQWLSRPPTLGGLGALALEHGEAPVVLLWSAEAVLVADWNPWQGDQFKIWDACPMAALRRTDLPVASGSAWADLQRQSTLSVAPSPAAQVKILGVKEFEKATKGASWPFGPSVVILEKLSARR